MADATCATCRHLDRYHTCEVIGDEFEGGGETEIITAPWRFGCIHHEPKGEELDD